MPRVDLPLSTAASQPLIVRLRNWVGDVVLGIPLLRLLQAHGYELQLVGKPWARDLLQGEGWAFEALAADGLSRIRQLRALRQHCRARDPRFDQRLNALTLPFSFSSALEMRGAGLRAAGYAHDGRGWLLSRAPRQVPGLHELVSYWRLAAPFLPSPPPDPSPNDPIGMRIGADHLRAAEALCLAHRLQPGFSLLCPFAGGTYDKQPKTWPAFAEFARALQQDGQGRRVVLCPGPGEEQQARDCCPEGGLVLTGVKLGVYAALLQRHAGLMVSNDTGPGHLAAAVGTPTLSVLGPTDPAQWRPWGPQAVCVQGPGKQWPSPDEVMRQARLMLQPPRQARPHGA